MSWMSQGIHIFVIYILFLSVSNAMYNIFKRRDNPYFYDILKKDLCFLKSGSFNISSIENKKCLFHLLKDLFFLHEI